MLPHIRIYAKQTFEHRIEAFSKYCEVSLSALVGWYHLNLISCPPPSHVSSTHLPCCHSSLWGSSPRLLLLSADTAVTLWRRVKSTHKPCVVSVKYSSRLLSNRYILIDLEQNVICDARRCYHRIKGGDFTTVVSLVSTILHIIYAIKYLYFYLKYKSCQFSHLKLLFWLFKVFIRIQDESKNHVHTGVSIISIISIMDSWCIVPPPLLLIKTNGPGFCTNLSHN